MSLQLDCACYSIRCLQTSNKLTPFQPSPAPCSFCCAKRSGRRPGQRGGGEFVAIKGSWWVNRHKVFSCLARWSFYSGACLVVCLCSLLLQQP